MRRDGGYRYRALRPDGSVEAGSLHCGSREDAASELSAQGLFPVEIRWSGDGTGRVLRLSRSDLALGLRLLADLLSAGLPMSRALDAFDHVAPLAWRRALPGIHEAVRRGQSLSAALEAASLGIPLPLVAILRAGEAGEGLATATFRAAEVAEGVAETQAAIRNALAYPLILALASGASVALLLGVVLPRLAALLADSGQSLPASTRLVLGAALAIRSSAAVIAMAGLVLVVAFHEWVATEHGRLAWHSLLLRMPLVGSVRRCAATARAAGSMAALLGAGVPLPIALVNGAEAAGDAAMRAALLDAREAILGGQGVARSVSAVSALTPTAGHLIRVGEETGKLAEMMARVARMELVSLERTVKAAVRLIEPAMVLGFGALIALVAAALLQAVYGVRFAP